MRAPRKPSTLLPRIRPSSPTLTYTITRSTPLPSTPSHDAAARKKTSVTQATCSVSCLSPTRAFADETFRFLPFARTLTTTPQLEPTASAVSQDATNHAPNISPFNSSKSNSRVSTPSSPAAESRIGNWQLDQAELDEHMRAGNIVTTQIAPRSPNPFRSTHTDTHLHTGDGTIDENSLLPFSAAQAQVGIRRTLPSFPSPVFNRILFLPPDCIH